MFCYLMVTAKSKQINKIKGCDYDGCGELSSLADASVWTCVGLVLWELVDRSYMLHCTNDDSSSPS